MSRGDGNCATGEKRAWWWQWRIGRNCVDSRDVYSTELTELD